jgi:hypothetical protein
MIYKAPNFKLILILYYFFHFIKYRNFLLQSNITVTFLEKNKSSFKLVREIERFESLQKRNESLGAALIPVGCGDRLGSDDCG